MAETIDLSIIIPAYMEGKYIGRSLQQLADILKTRDFGQVEVLVIVPDSPDDTVAAAQAKAGLFDHFRVIDAGRRVGKGRDVRLGMFEARGRYRLFMDADLATPLGHLDDVQAAIKRGDKVIIAVRDLLRIHKGLLRKFMSKFGNLVAQVLILPGIKDTQCGFKAFEAEAAVKIFGRQTMTGWSFDAEVLKIARRMGYKITLINASDWKDPKTEGMGLVGDSPLKAAIATFVDLFIIRWNSWTGRYNKPSYTHEPTS